MNRPDFSPAMLKAFLRLRADLAVTRDPEAAADRRLQQRVRLEFCRQVRRQAGVRQADFRRAWNGEATLAPEPRRKIWAAMDLDPAEAGVRFTDDGGQEPVSSRAHRPSELLSKGACAPDGAGFDARPLSGEPLAGTPPSAGRRSAPAGARPKQRKAGQ